jgi:glycerophosphoryl diester phosphodiesterase
MRAMRAAIAALAVAVLAAAPAHAVEIHAHRGGPIENGVATSPEDTRPAFERGYSLGTDVVELDAKITADGVPVVIHDATLDRTTDCTGRVDAKTLAELAACHVDTVGTDPVLKPSPGSQVAVPPLSEVLAWAKAGRVRLNLEIKNIPTDPDYDPSPAFARTILGAVDASGIPRGLVLIQSFWPPDLDEAHAQGFRTSFLTLAQTNDQSVEYAQARGYEVLSPQWPVSKSFVERAHAAGKQVVPYTFNAEDEVTAAKEAGVDAVITNDVLVAERSLYGIDCPTARRQESTLRAALVKARAARARARKGEPRRKADAKVRRVNQKRQAIKRLRRRACGPGG